MNELQKKTLDRAIIWMQEISGKRMISVETEQLPSGSVLAILSSSKLDMYDNNNKHCVFVIGCRGGLKQSKKNNDGLVRVSSVWKLKNY